MAGVALIILVTAACASGAVSLGVAMRRRETGLGPVTELAFASLVVFVLISVAASYLLFIGAGMHLSWMLPSVATLVVSSFVIKNDPAGTSRFFAAIWEAVSSQRTLWLLVSLMILVQVSLTVIVLAYIGDAGWDAAWYHLPIVGSMIQSGSLFGWPELVAWQWYPALIESQGAVLGVGVGSVKAASLIQLIYWIWLGVFVAAFTAHRGNQMAAVATTIAILVIPTVWFQARTLFVDLAFSALLVAAIISAVLAFQNRHSLLILSAALLTGALVAVKLVPLPVLPLAIVVFVIALSSAETRRVALLVVILGVVPALPFYVRNLMETGHATYPVSLTQPSDESVAWPDPPPYSVSDMRRIAGASQKPTASVGLSTAQSVFRSYVVTPVRESLAPLSDSVHAGNRLYTYKMDSREGGFGTAWLALLGIGAIAAVAAVAKARQVRLARASTAVLLLGLTSLATLTALFAHAIWWPRFVLGSAVILAVVAGLAISRFRVAGIVALIVVVPIALQTAYLAEDNGGVGVWSDLGTPELRQGIKDTGLSIFTMSYTPLLESHAQEVAIVGRPPMFSIGLWGNDWDMSVFNLDIGGTSSAEQPACIGAFVAGALDLDRVRHHIERTGDMYEYSVVPWDDAGTPRLWIIRNEACSAG